MSSGANPSPRAERMAAQRNREAAFARISRVRGVTVVGAGVLTAAVAGAVSAIAPGHTLGAKLPAHAAKAPTRSSSSATMPPLASGSQLGLNGPQSAPAPQTQTQTQPGTQTQTQTQPSASAQQPSVVSGGS
jgi:hypothetical protein